MHRKGCPAGGSSAGATCTCGESQGRMDPSVFARFIQVCKDHRANRATLALSYKFRKTPGEFEVEHEWSEATDCFVKNDEEGAEDPLHLVVDDDGGWVEFPLEGYEYKNCRVKVKNLLPIHRAEGRGDEAQRTEGEETKKRLRTDTGNIDGTDFDALTPLLLGTSSDLTMARLILVNQFGLRIGARDRRENALEALIQWAESTDKNSAMIERSLELGRTLHTSLRLACLSYNTKNSEMLLSNRLRQQDTSDPIERLSAQLQTESRRNDRNSRNYQGRGGGRSGVFRGSRIWGGAAPQLPPYNNTLVNPNNDTNTPRPRTCKYCGNIHVGDWKNHICPKGPTNNQNRH